ncbi:MAG: rubredoxin [Bacillota bacterium]
MWQCQVCGYIHDGDEAPERCPKCGAPKEKFIELPTEKAELVVRSRFTNQLLAEVMGLGEELLGLAAEGIEDKLDPACVKIFQYIEKAGLEMLQMAKAEIATHISKGKWG